MKRFLALVLLSSLLLSGCRQSNVQYGTKEISNIKPNLLSLRGSRAVAYNYMVDANTGVVYLEAYGINRYAITVMLNADGTPVTAEQLGIEY